MLRFREPRCCTQERSLAYEIVNEKTVGSADLEVCLARLKSVEQRPNCWIQTGTIRLTS